jgi:hypothetical protein
MFFGICGATACGLRIRPVWLVFLPSSNEAMRQRTAAAGPGLGVEIHCKVRSRAWLAHRAIWRRAGS